MSHVVDAFTGDTVPHLRDWSGDDFGGRSYGLEPLVLPSQPPAPAPLESGLPRIPFHARRSHAVEPVSVFWFRWIVGHQVTFVLWQLLANAVHDTADPACGGEATRRAARLVRGCSAMLLYTGSCPREIYHRVIRPSMALAHPGFSGSWARDYPLVRNVLRGHVRLQHADGRTLLAEQRLNALIHAGVAATLVPSAPSLLKAFTAESTLCHAELLTALYDSYFLTVRGQVSYDVVVTQLLRRLDVIAHDVTTTGLYPDFASSESEKDLRLREPPVLACERDLPQILADIAEDVTKSPLLSLRHDEARHPRRET
jgi:hypothetical protein